ncbi:unnamed protein product [Pedinophyceae sp. YPF-701]|nr:unnamed protein product [Pedinophyceae sp. YPF-701]
MLRLSAGSALDAGLAWWIGVCWRRPLACIVVAVAAAVLGSLASVGTDPLATMAIGKRDADGWRTALFGRSGQRDLIAATKRLIEESPSRMHSESLGTEQRARSELLGQTEFYVAYRSRDGEMITAEAMEVIHDVEQRLLLETPWVDHCMLQFDSITTGECARPRSVANYVYPRSLEQAAAGFPGYGSTAKDVTEAVSVLSFQMAANYMGIAQDSMFRQGFFWFFDRGFRPGHLHSEHVLTALPFGYPTGHDSPRVARRSLWKAVQEHMDAKMWQSVGGQSQFGTITRFLKSPYELRVSHPAQQDIELLWFSQPLFLNEMVRCGVRDAGVAGATGLCIAAWMLLHTRSLSITACGTFASMIAFPLTFGVYRWVLGVTFFEVLHVVALFLFLGVGADDVFIFFDAASSAVEALSHSADNQKEEVFKRAMMPAARSVFATSVTTSFSFLAGCIAGVPAVMAFSIFSAVGFAVMWVLCVAVMVPCCASWAQHRTSKRPQHDIRGRLSRVLQSSWLPQVNALRWPIFLLFLGSLAHGTMMLGRMQGDFRVEEAFFPPGHMFSRFLELLGPEGPHGIPSKMHATLSWGILGLEGDEASIRGGTKPDEVVRDRSMDVTSKPAQRFLLGLCDKAVDPVLFPCSLERCRGASGGAQSGILVHDKERAAKAEDACLFHRLENQLQFARGDAEAGEPDIVHGTLDPDEYIRAIQEIARTDTVTDPAYRALVSEDDDGTPHMFYLSVNFALPFSPADSREAEVMWADLVRVQNWVNEHAPEGLRNARIHVGNKFAVMEQQGGIVRGALISMGLVWAASSLVVVVITRSAAVALIIGTTVAGITATVVGTLATGINGWAVGVAETTSIALVVGLSIDYGLHVAVGYCESNGKTAMKRLEESLGQVGPALVSGCVTTAGSALLLACGRLMFFRRVAFYLIATLVTSLLWTSLFLVSALLIFEPCIQPPARKGASAGTFVRKGV